MRDASVSTVATAAKILGAILLACCLQSCLVTAQTGDSSKMDQEWSKRDWKNDLHIWGKKRSIPESWNNQAFAAPEKRAWQNLQSGWGKRYAPEDEINNRPMATLLNLEDNIPKYYNEDDYEAETGFNDEVKRNWGQFHGGWGKRGQWEKFRGSWGKREPAWTNLRGVWGKRIPDQIAQ